MGRRVLRCLDEWEGRRSAGRHLLGRPYQGADSALYRLLHGLPGEALLALLAETDQRYARPRLLHYWLHLRAVRPLVDGHDLHALGVPPGPKLGHLLERLLEAQIDGHFSDRQAALAEARRLAAGETGEGG
jgi:tRNA nucleotidyltransferase (CCA-adding enzyme)